jgi:hypothetical protein
MFVRASGDFLPPSPPAEQATARGDQPGHPRAGNRSRNGTYGADCLHSRNGRIILEAGGAEAARGDGFSYQASGRISGITIVGLRVPEWRCAGLEKQETSGSAKIEIRVRRIRAEIGSCNLNATVRRCQVEWRSARSVQCEIPTGNVVGTKCSNCSVSCYGSCDRYKRGIWVRGTQTTLSCF